MRATLSGSEKYLQINLGHTVQTKLFFSNICNYFATDYLLHAFFLHI